MTFKSCIHHFESLCESKGKALFTVKYVVLELSQKTPSEFYAEINQDVPDDVFASINRVMHAYMDEDIPIDYALGYAYFYGHKLMVNQHVLVPRRETEELVEYALMILDTLQEPIKVLDLGTGSGCIGLTIKKEMPHVLVTVSDISHHALEVVQNNIKLLNVDVDMIQSDWFSNIDDTYDVIISNPPYLLRGEDIGDTVSSEPEVALYGGNLGLDHYESILKNITKHMHEKTYIMFEHGYQQAYDLQQLIRSYLPNMNVITVKDMQGLKRMTMAVHKKYTFPFEGDTL
jgi:release factor glutamine methyltransferase